MCLPFEYGGAITSDYLVFLFLLLNLLCFYVLYLCCILNSASGNHSRNGEHVIRVIPLLTHCINDSTSTHLLMSQCTTKISSTHLGIHGIKFVIVVPVSV
jgi:hypothetical protein